MLISLSNILTSYACWLLLDFLSFYMFNWERRVLFIIQCIMMTIFIHRVVISGSQCILYLFWSLKSLENLLYLLKFLHRSATKDRFSTIINKIWPLNSLTTPFSKNSLCLPWLFCICKSKDKYLLCIISNDLR